MQSHSKFFWAIILPLTLWTLLVGPAWFRESVSCCYSQEPPKSDCRSVAKTDQAVLQLDKSPFLLELFGQVPKQPWRLRESRPFLVRVTNQTNNPIVLPDYSKVKDGSLLGAFGIGIVGYTENYNPGGFYGFPSRGTPDEFKKIEPKAALEEIIEVSPIAPDALLIEACFINVRNKRAESYSVVSKPGTKYMIAGIRYIPVEGVWLGQMACHAVYEISSELSTEAIRQQKELRKLLDQQIIPIEERQKAFTTFVEPDDWVSWKFCGEAVENKTWESVHQLAKQRIIQLVNRGLAAPEWNAFLKKIETSPAWDSLRVACVASIGQVAGGPSVDSEQRLIAFRGTETQIQASLNLLKRWANNGQPEEVKRRARAVLAEMQVPYELTISNQPLGKATVIAKGSWSGHGPLSELAKIFQIKYPQVEIQILGQNNSRGFQDLANRKMDIAIYSQNESHDVASVLKQAFPPPQAMPERILWGKFVSCVIVNAQNPLKQISEEQLSKIYSNRFAKDEAIRNWEKILGDKVKKGNIACYAERRGLKSNEILQNQILRGDEFQEEVQWCESGQQILEKVAQDVNGIGFLPFQEKLFANPRVKVLAIGTDNPVLPSIKSIFENRERNEIYPIYERLLLYVHPNASLAAKDFSRFAAQVEPTPKMREIGLWTAYDQNKYWEELRRRKLRIPVEVGKGTFRIFLKN